KPAAVPDRELAAATIPLSEETLPSIWQRVVSRTPPLFAGFLEKAGLPAISGPNSLVLRFPAGYTLEQEYCGEASRVTRMEDELTQIIGGRCKLRVELVRDSQSPSPPSKIDEGSASRPRGKRAEVALDVVTKRPLDV